MGIDFIADEILAIAVRIEQNGARYYFQASNQIADTSAKSMFHGLAVLEQVHEKTFTEMREKLSKQERLPVTFDPDNESGAYLDALANGRVFDLQSDPVKNLGGRESVEDIIKLAIGMEKDSIIFYLGMRDLVPPAFGKDAVDRIIKEEMGHIGLLSRELAIAERTKK